VVGEGSLEGKEGDLGFRAQSVVARRARSRLSFDERGLMHGRLIELAEELVHARPANEDEAQATLEWIAIRDGKGLAELIEERRRLQFRGAGPR
jgi:hypothetical protein